MCPNNSNTAARSNRYPLKVDRRHLKGCRQRQQELTYSCGGADIVDPTGVPDTTISHVLQVTSAVALPVIACLATIGVTMWWSQRRQGAVSDQERLFPGAIVLLILGTILLAAMVLGGPVVPTWVGLTLLVVGCLAGVVVERDSARRADPSADT
jgi:hypothetical protein